VTGANARIAPRPLIHVEERRAAATVVVIGTGAAGLRAAIELTERGVQVLCVGKRRRDDAHTVLASGGINAALATMDPEDSWEQHAADTLRESYWLADPLARRSPARMTAGSRNASSGRIAGGAPASPGTTPAARSSGC
jgi:glycine/D-amino acid oxidase-like deaminating enzyme